LPDLRPLRNLLTDRIHALPLVVVYLTDGCNSRCATCDIWKVPRRNMSLALAERLAADCAALGVRRVVLSGGEAMQHPEWPRIATLFRAAGARVTLLTNGLLLNKQADAVRASIDDLTVSLDGGTPETYQAIRGVDGFALILEGMRACAGLPITTRTTLQRANFREMPQIIDAAKSVGAAKISFLAVDVSNREAFGPRFADLAANYATEHAPLSPALTADELPEFAEMLDRLERDYAADFASGRLAESPAKLRRLHRYFAALNGITIFDPPRCNAPHVSAVIEVDGSLRPCFFLPKVGTLADHGVNQPLRSALNSTDAIAMRAAYRAGERPECERCVCALYQSPRALIR